MDKIFITTYNMRLYKAYANQLITSYLKTKQTKPMYVFVEDDPKKYPQENNVHYINLYDEEPELQRFVERNKHRVANNFYEEAIRFSYKVFAQSAARKYGEKVYYVDSDCVFTAQIPNSWYESCLPDNIFLAFYNRTKQYTETGFVAFNNMRKVSLQFFKDYKDFYVKDTVYNIQRSGKNFWTDCHTLDGTRQLYQDNPEYSEYKLGDGQIGHIIARDQFINPYIDHRKGSRKEQQHSPEWSRHSNSSPYSPERRKYK